MFVFFQTFSMVIRYRRRQENGQNYRYVWQLDPTRRRWLRAHPDRPDKDRCIICYKGFNAHLRTINDHALSNAHLRNLNNLKSRIKIVLCMFFAKHHLPFLLIDESLPLIINVAQNFNALKEVKMKRNTMQKICNNVISVSYTPELIIALRNNSFSILFDELTNVTTKKHGCVVVRFFNLQLSKVITALWAIVPIYNDDDEMSEATANSHVRAHMRIT